MRTMLAIVFILSAMFARADDSTPSKVVKPEQKAAETASDKRGTKGFPAVIEIEKSSVIRVEATDITERRHDYTNGEWWLVYLTGALAFVTFLLALYTGKLYRATVRLGEDAKKTSDRQETEMRESLAISKQSADAAKSQAEMVVAEYIGTHVPRLIVRRVQLRCDEFRGIEFVLANIGDSYAPNITGDINIKTIFSSEARKFEKQSIPLYGGAHIDISKMVKDATLGHDETLQAGERQPIFIASDKITDDIYSRLTSRGEVLYFFGKIRYWNRTGTVSREMGFFRTCMFDGDKWTFQAKADDPDYEWN